MAEATVRDPGRHPPVMIGFLRGRVLEKHPTRVIVETGGVGYEVHVPLSSYSAVGEPGADVALRIHTHVREDALQLFGFATPLELALFDRLVAVSGIGPKLALAGLSGIAPAAEKAVDAALAATGGAFEASLRRALESLTRGGRK